MLVTMCLLKYCMKNNCLEKVSCMRCGWLSFVEGGLSIWIWGLHKRTNKLKYIPYSNAPLAPTSLVSVRIWDGRREGLPSHTLTATRRIFRQFHLLPLGIYFSLFCWLMNSTLIICCEVHTRKTCFLYLISSKKRRFFT